MISRSTRPHTAALRRSVAPRRLVALAVAALLLLACPSGDEPEERGETTHPRNEPARSPESRSTVPPERALDATSLRNMSELLAGLAPSRGVADGISPVWRRHAEDSEAIWARLAPRFETMRTWSRTRMAELPVPTAPLLSPFGDPDLITSLQLFPAARSYLLVGQEAPGRLPLPEDFSAEELEDDLRRLRTTFLTLADSGYFVRSRLQAGIRGGAFDGVLPILLVSLVRGGQVPVRLEYVGFDAETKEIQPLPPAAEKARALRIFFRAEDAGDETMRSVYYFSRDLSNEGLLTDESLAYLLRRQDALNVLLKAAEYRLHSSDYSLFRKLLLEEASSLLQDDSGVPIRFLTSDRWELHLYGRYRDVLAAYRSYRQDDLAAAFHKAQPPVLGFPIGFHSDPEGGGLILALRKDDMERLPKSRADVPAPSGDGPAAAEKPSGHSADDSAAESAEESGR